ncbi:MAG: radical SAM protein [Spirochaetota bacterium]
MAATVHPKAVTRALRKSDLSGTFVVSKYSFSPYMACEHGCAYCDGRAERYWVDGSFDRDVVARRNLPSLLETELPKLREPGFVSIGSGISDAYQPLERSELIMRRSLEVLAQHDHPVTVMTKSALPLRDLDLARAINDRSRFLLIVSLVHARDDTRARYEPGAASVMERLAMLRAFRDAGCATGALAMPLLPGITDDDETIGAIYDELAECGVSFIQPGGLTLRPGRQKEFFLARLAEHDPALAPLYERFYAEERKSGMPVSAATRELTERCLAHHRRVGIPFLVPHSVYHGLLAAYDETSVLLQHMVELYAAAGTDTTRLRRACDRYMRRLCDRKRTYNRRSSWDYRELSEEILAPGALERILENEKLALFLREVFANDKVMDYVSRHLLPETADCPPAACPRGGA